MTKDSYDTEQGLNSQISSLKRKKYVMHPRYMQRNPPLLDDLEKIKTFYTLLAQELEDYYRLPVVKTNDKKNDVQVRDLIRRAKLVDNPE